MKSPKYLPTAVSWRHFSKHSPRSWQHGDGCGSHAISELRTHKKSVEGVAISGMISPSCMVQWLSVAIQSYLFHPKMVEFRHSSPPLISGSLNSMIDVRMVKNSQPGVEAETVKQPVQFSKMGFLWLAMVMPLVKWLNNVRWCTRWCRS